MQYTLRTASKACGMGKTAIYNAIKSGRLSAKRDEKGQYQIDPSELHRVFPTLQPEKRTGQDATEGDSLENTYLKEKIRLLETQLERERAQADHWREQAERMTLLLTHQPPAAAANTNDTLKPPPSFLRRLFGNR